MRYHTFDLTVSAGGAPHVYNLLAQSSSQGEASAQTQIDTGSPLFSRHFQQEVIDNLVMSELRSFGATLYHSLFVDDIALLFNRASGETLHDYQLGLRLRLRFFSPELAVLPWEFLYSPERKAFFAASVEMPLSRYFVQTEPMQMLAWSEQINLLAVIPQNSDLDTTSEREVLIEFSKKAVPQIVIDFLEGEATCKTVRAALHKKKYHIFHYAGSGSFKNEEAFIYLDHAEKLTEPVSAAQFTQFFLDWPSLRLAVLNVGKGAQLSSYQALVHLAPQLVLRGVPAVVAMQFPIDNNDAMLFAAEFYAELSSAHAGGQVETAMSRARKALARESGNLCSFGAPALFLSSKADQLWQPLPQQSKNQPKEKKSPLKKWKSWAALVSAVVVLITAIIQLIIMLIPGPEPIDGVGACEFIGTVIDVAGNPVSNAEVIVVGQKTTGQTDSNGVFSIEVSEKKGEVVEVVVKKDGREGYNGLETLPGPVTITLRRGL